MPALGLSCGLRYLQSSLPRAWSLVAAWKLCCCMWNLVPDQGLNSGPLSWDHSQWTTGEVPQFHSWKLFAVTFWVSKVDIFACLFFTVSTLKKPNYFKASMIHNEKSSTVWIVYGVLPLAAFKILFIVSGFHQFNYGVPLCGFLWVFPIWDSQRLFWLHEFMSLTKLGNS